MERIMDEKKNENIEATEEIEEINEIETDEELLEDDGIITLRAADGEEIDFVEIAGIAHGGQFYVILQPVELMPEMEDDEALVFHVTSRDDGELGYEIVIDDEIVDAVFKEYYKLLDNNQ